MPSLQLKSIYDLDTEKLKQLGIKGIITDLDNTLIDWNQPDATPELLEWFKNLTDEGFRIIVLSNNNDERVRRFAEPHGISYIPAARKPGKNAFRTALHKLGLSEQETVVIGDQLFTDILGGNRMGLFTILVIPTATTDAWITRFNRLMERFVLRRLRKKGFK